MKKNLLFIGLMLALSLSASAQNDGFAFGFKVGPNLGWTGSTTKTAEIVGSRAGFDLGVVAEFYFAENYAISTGVNVGFMGGHYSFNNAIRLDSLGNPDVFSVDRIYKTTIYEIPIMLKMVTNELGNAPVRIYAQVGAGLGLVPQKVRVKDAIPADGIVTPDKWSITNKEYSLFRTSLKIGAGAQYALDESTRLFAGFYFSHDFINNINHWSPNYAGNYYDENGEKVGDRDTKLNVLQNRVGFEMGVLF